MVLVSFVIFCGVLKLLVGENTFFYMKHHNLTRVSMDHNQITHNCISKDDSWMLGTVVVSMWNLIRSTKKLAMKDFRA
jgi:hypothetical protein